MEKEKVVTFEVKIEVWAGGENTGGKNNFQIYPWKEVAARKIKMREKLRPIAEAVEKVKLPVSVVVLLGDHYCLPLLVVIRKIGNLSFSEGKLESIQLFNGDETALREAITKTIQTEFRNKLLEFLDEKQEEKLRESVTYAAISAKLVNESSQIRGLCERF